VDQDAPPGDAGNSTQTAAQGDSHAIAVLEASPNAIVAVDADKGQIVYANPQVEVTFGYRSDELIGQPIGILIPERYRQRHARHRSGYMDRPEARAMGIGRELWARRKDGSEFPVEISLSPITLDGTMQVYATVVDITARRTAEEALAESERRFRTVLEASPNAILGVAADGRIVYVNPRVSGTFGYTADELVGRPIEQLLPDRVADRHIGHRARFVERAAARPMGLGIDLAARRKDGTEFPVEISLSPVDTPDGLLVFATVVDITARKSLESQLLQAQKMESIGRLAGGIAHDFNNMLSAIRGYADLVRDDLANPHVTLDRGTLDGWVGAIRGAADRAATLTSQLLAFSRQQVMSPTVVELADVVRALEPMLRRLIGEHIRLVLRLDDDTGNLRMDPGQLDQTILNLVVNARDAMPSGGTVTIETTNTTISEPYAIEHFDLDPGPYVILSVSDTGIGMDRETKEHIFEPFFTTKERGKGTGLGLATIYGIVRQSGGHIWLYSEPGHGTTFKIYFPRVDLPASVEPASGGGPAETGAGTILVVEDEDAVRDLLMVVLRRAGYELVAARDPQEAIELVSRRQGEIDVLVSDVVMPGLSGPELARQLRERIPTIGIVLLSGYTAETLDLAGLLSQGAQFVPKPFSSQDLLRAVARAAAGSRENRPGGSGGTGGADATTARGGPEDAGGGEPPTGVARVHRGSGQTAER
jgi:PAS domain S-box-containing protein